MTSMQRGLALFTRWFGPLKRPTPFTPPRWEEGLASFVEDLAVDSLNGRMVTDKNAQWLVGRLRQMVARDPGLATAPLVDYGKQKQSMAEYSYSVGGLAFYLMYRVMGHDAFTRLIRDYYGAHAAGGGSTDELFAMARRASPVPIDPLIDDWISTTRWTAVVATQDAPGLVSRYRNGAADNLAFQIVLNTGRGSLRRRRPASSWPARRRIRRAQCCRAQRSRSRPPSVRRACLSWSPTRPARSNSSAFRPASTTCASNSPDSRRA